MSQEIKIYNYMKHVGGITPLTALKKFGCFRLGARIHDLRSLGFNIKTLIVEENKKRYAKYILSK